MPVPVSLLLTHMRKHYTDFQIDRDVDCVAFLCGCDEDREAVERYAKARRKAPDFKPRVPNHSNANRVIEAPEDAEVDPSGCEWCGKPFTRTRSTSRFCSDTCRKAANRGGVSR